MQAGDRRHACALGSGRSTVTCLFAWTTGMVQPHPEPPNFIQTLGGSTVTDCRGMTARPFQLADFAVKSRQAIARSLSGTDSWFMQHGRGKIQQRIRRRPQSCAIGVLGTRQ
jgi:hypothetical protein